MTWLQIWPIICYMEEQGILEKGKEGTVTLTRTPEQMEELVDSQQWKQLFGEEEAKRRSTDLLHLVFRQLPRNQFTLLRLRQGRGFWRKGRKVR